MDEPKTWKIKLSNGMSVIVDKEDHASLAKHKWHLQDGYAIRTEKGKPIMMHRLISSAPNKLPVQYKNRNKLDNRKENLILTYHRRNESERFWTFVNKKGKNGCWEWTGTKSSGYGSFRVGINRLGTYKMVRANRYIWEKLKGPIPKGLLVCHTCDIPHYVNPNHLFLGTVADNNWDKIRKGRCPISNKTHCKYGHEFSGDNLILYGPNNWRKCRSCQETKKRKYREAYKQGAGKL